MPNQDIATLLQRLKKALLDLQQEATAGRVQESTIEAVDAAVPEELAQDERIYSLVERLADVMVRLEADPKHVPEGFLPHLEELIRSVEEKVREMGGGVAN